MKLFIRWMKNRGIALYHIYKCTDQSFCSGDSGGPQEEFIMGLPYTP